VCLYSHGSLRKEETQRHKENVQNTDPQKKKQGSCVYVTAIGAYKREETYREKVKGKRNYPKERKKNSFAYDSHSGS